MFVCLLEEINGKNNAMGHHGNLVTSTRLRGNRNARQIFIFLHINRYFYHDNLCGVFSVLAIPCYTSSNHVFVRQFGRKKEKKDVAEIKVCSDICQVTGEYNWLVLLMYRCFYGMTSCVES